ncbi:MULTISPECIES: TIGR02452 family protein [Pseudofrankia]|uniref:TIGR02452 family protein n=1 Tax=Pseudofrankia TaxID=2994363 RepID=UPI000234BD5E|nr:MULTISPECIES: TIGR02452 family protein [Pseudofrankia]OHV37018.1 TIGR02452 family protein [Pseudofrankia sp. EUN1h]
MKERLRKIAEETVRIVDAGGYTAPDGRRVDISERVRRAVEGTVLYGPEPVDAVPPATVPPGASAPAAPGQAPRPARLEVTGETTFAAARRMLAASPGPVAALNFASARWPGGGFLSGARAQEEYLCRLSALYACLVGVDDYYRPHNAAGTSLYSDRVLHSPAVPVFRDEDFSLLPEPVDVGILTAAAPYATGLARDEPHLLWLLPRTFQSRCRQVLAVAARHGYRRLVLGAWGCGAFGNDPAVVAAAFAELLLPGGAFAGHFDEVGFAILRQHESESGTGNVFAAALGLT